MQLQLKDLSNISSCFSYYDHAFFPAGLLGRSIAKQGAALFGDIG